MPKRADLQSILVLGSGLIVISQAAEFAYSGAPQAEVSDLLWDDSEKLITHFCCPGSERAWARVR